MATFLKINAKWIKHRVKSFNTIKKPARLFNKKKATYINFSKKFIFPFYAKLKFEKKSFLKNIRNLRYR